MCLVAWLVQFSCVLYLHFGIGQAPPWWPDSLAISPLPETSLGLPLSSWSLVACCPVGGQRCQSLADQVSPSFCCCCAPLFCLAVYSFLSPLCHQNWNLIVLPLVYYPWTSSFEMVQPCFHLYLHFWVFAGKVHYFPSGAGILWSGWTTLERVMENSEHLASRDGQFGVYLWCLVTTSPGLSTAEWLCNSPEVPDPVWENQCLCWSEVVCHSFAAYVHRTTFDMCLWLYSLSW